MQHQNIYETLRQRSVQMAKRLRRIVQEREFAALRETFIVEK